MSVCTRTSVGGAYRRVQARAQGLTSSMALQIEFWASRHMASNFRRMDSSPSTPRTCCSIILKCHQVGQISVEQGLQLQTLSKYGQPYAKKKSMKQP